MHQGRTQAKTALLGLLALALHLLLSFSHHHESLSESRNEAQAAVCLTDDDCRIGGDQAPGQHEHSCEICTVLAMARATCIPAAPMFAVPTSFHCVVFEIPETARIAYTPHDAFQARAPPALPLTL